MAKPSFLERLEMALLWGLKPPDVRTDEIHFPRVSGETKWWVVFWRVAGVASRYGSYVAFLRPFTGWVNDFDASAITDAPLVMAEGMSAGVRVFWHPDRNLVGAAVEDSHDLRPENADAKRTVRELMRRRLATMVVTPPDPSVLSDMGSLRAFARELGTLEAIEFRYPDAPRAGG